jgi:hypothetical protein
MGERGIVDRDRRAIGNEEADAPQRIHGRERHDERRQAELHDAEAVKDADCGPDEERDRHRAEDRGSEAEIVGEEPGDHHADEALDRTDGKINAPGNDDEGLADRQYSDERGLTQEVRHVVGGPECARRVGERNPHEEQEAEECQPQQHAESAAIALRYRLLLHSDFAFRLRRRSLRSKLPRARHPCGHVWPRCHRAGTHAVCRRVRRLREGMMRS